MHRQRVRECKGRGRDIHTGPFLIIIYAMWQHDVRDHLMYMLHNFLFTSLAWKCSSSFLYIDRVLYMHTL